jgi:DedD protein
MAEPADINVDELRRRARRRLVGAIVLALGAAVIVPMLLESDPKPLGDDVAVKIPPVDDSKFVNRLNEPQPKSEPIKGDANSASVKDSRKDVASQAEPLARRSVADAEKAVIAPPAKTPKYDTAVAPEKIAAAPVTPAAPAAPIAAEPTPSPQAPTELKTAPAAPTEAKATPAAPTEAKATPAAPPTPGESKVAVASPSVSTPQQLLREGYAVQLAAYSDDKGANALATRLKRSGYPAYTEPLKTSRGTLWRVRVGPYSSRDAATGVRDKLKAEGQSGIVASAR